MEEVKTAPAIGYSMIANLPGDRQVTVQCFVAHDEPDDVVNARFDRIFRFIDRQKARYELQDFEEELPKLRETLAQFEEDFAAVDARFEKQQAEADLQILELNKKAEEIEANARSAHNIAGRRGSFKLVGADESNVRNIRSGIEQIKLGKEKAVNERDEHKRNLDISLERHRKGIANLEAKMALRRRLLGEDEVATG